MAEFDRL